MTVYTYWGNKDEVTDGTAGILVAAGLIYVGQSIDLTLAEYNFLSKSLILMPGVVPWNRGDFKWDVEHFSHITSGVIGGLLFPIDGGLSSTISFPQSVDGGTSSTISFVANIDGGIG